MNKIPYTIVSEGAILRDYITPDYLNEDHKTLVDIADFLYNANLTPDYLTTEAKAIYDSYGKEYWEKVLKDMEAIDSQLLNDTHRNNLILDYTDHLLEVKK